MPEDPNALVTVDEIQEESEDHEHQPFVTIDEMTEDDEDFLADFNRLKEELNFVTVDEVGEEDEEEEAETTFTGTDVEANTDIKAAVESEEGDAMATDELGLDECEPESKRRKVDSAGEKPSEASSATEDLDFLLPKAGYFCQICTLFYPDEASMRSHCRTPHHQQNMKEKGEGEPEELSSR
uniref:Matrin-type domain-containing protein n=1 Tax=Sphenodon punctatus TaxID=8508 RepID=A0A8D0GIE1_SPHPU